MRQLISVFLLLVASTTPAYAYIGPGAGAGAIALVFGVIVSVFLAFLAIVWYPIKRLFSKRRRSARARGASSDPEHSEKKASETA